MSSGNILVISIIALSFVLIIVTAILTYKKVQPTLQEIKELNDTINQKKNMYTQDVDHITDRVNEINQKAQFIQQNAEIKTKHFQDLMDEQGQFQNSLNYLKGHAGEYSSGIASNIKDELKEDGPKIVETFKRAFKKTAQKQKVRYKK